MAGLSGFISPNHLFKNPDELLSIFERVHQINGVIYCKRTHTTEYSAIQNLLTGHITTGLSQPAISNDGKVSLFF